MIEDEEKKHQFWRREDFVCLLLNVNEWRDFQWWIDRVNHLVSAIHSNIFYTDKVRWYLLLNRERLFTVKCIHVRKPGEYVNHSKKMVW